MRPLLFGTKPGTLLLWTGLALVLLTLMPAATEADVVLGNFGTGDGGNVNISSNNYAAASFTMGSQAYSLSDVQIRLTGNVTPGLTFQLRDDASGNPSNNVLFAFNNLSITTTATETYTFSAGSPFTLTLRPVGWTRFPTPTLREVERPSTSTRNLRIRERPGPTLPTHQNSS
jgi:hypothetical protein